MVFGDSGSWQNNMNICLISGEYPPETGFGGIGTYTYHLAQGLTKVGHDVTVISKALKMNQYYEDSGVKVYRIIPKPFIFKGLSRVANFMTKGLFGRWWYSKSIFRKIEEIVKEKGKFDVIQGPLWDGECFSYSNKLETPLVVRLHTPVFKTREILNLSPSLNLEMLERESLLKATLIIAGSHNVADLIINKYNVARNKIIYSPLGIPLPKTEKPLFRKDSHKLLYVGRLEERKGAKEFIQALPKILTVNPKIRVDIVGRDCSENIGLPITYREYFRQIVPVKLQDKVKFHGFVEKERLEHFYKNCDVFIAPSRYESFGFVYLEAMAFGKPVIGTNSGGIPETVIDGKVGLLVDVNNPQAISDAVIKIFSNSIYRKEMGKRAFYYVRNNFDYMSMVNRELDIFFTAINIYQESQNERCK